MPPSPPAKTNADTNKGKPPAAKRVRKGRWSSAYFLRKAYKAATLLVNRNPSLRNLAVLVSAVGRQGRSLLKGSGVLAKSTEALPVFFSISATLLLVLLTMCYLHYRHAKSDFTRVKELRAFQIKLRDALVRLNCSPIMLRLAWSDSATYDKAIKQWPQCGGATGSVRFERENKTNANAGLEKAIEILQEIKSPYKTVSWADAIQMAGALAVEVSGGPVVPLRYGRTDAHELASHYSARSGEDGVLNNPPHFVPSSSSASPTSTSNTNPSLHRPSKPPSSHARGKASSCPLSTRLPSALPPFPDHSPSADVHMRNVFYRMGFSNRDIVALCGAHTLGRAFQDRTGVCPNTSGDQGATIYTRPTAIVKKDGSAGVGMPGGCSWTRNWLTFDNSYFQRDENDPDLLWLPTDRALRDCPEFRPFFVKYSKDQEAFFRDYAGAHRKMSENGSRFRPPQGLSL